MSWYCYTHHKPGGDVFYVGKGDLRRLRTIKRDNVRHAEIVRCYGGKIGVCIYTCETEAEAFELEKTLISHYRELGVELCNNSAGGEGPSGFRHSEETKQTLRIKSTGRKHTKEELEKMSASLIGRKQSPQQREANSLGQKTKMTEARKRQCREAAKSRVWTDEQRLAVSSQFRGIPKSKESNQKRSEALRAFYAAKRQEAQCQGQ